MPLIQRPYIQRILPLTMVAIFVAMYFVLRFETFLPIAVPAIGIILGSIYQLVEKGRLEDLLHKESYVIVFRNWISFTMIPSGAMTMLAIYLPPLMSYFLMASITAYALWGTFVLFKKLDSINVDAN